MLSEGSRVWIGIRISALEIFPRRFSTVEPPQGADPIVNATPEPAPKRVLPSEDVELGFRSRAVRWKVDLLGVEIHLSIDRYA